MCEGCWVYTQHECSARKGHWITWGWSYQWLCATHWEFWKPSPLEEQEGLLTTEPSFPPKPLILNNWDGIEMRLMQISFLARLKSHSAPGKGLGFAWFLANSSEELLLRTPGFLTPKYHLSHGPCSGPWVRWMSSAKSVISYGVFLTGCSDDLGCHWWPRLDSSPVIHLSQQAMVPVL